MYLFGEKADFKGPEDAQEAGIAAVYQYPTSYPHLTVAENIFMGHEKKKGFFLDDKAHSEGAKKILQRLEHEIPPETMVGDLRVGQQQMVEIARNLNQDDLRVLIMDEPTSSLSAAEVKVLFKIMRELLEAGISIVYISHRLEEIMEIGDHVTILRDGKQVADLTTKDTNPEELSAYMIGRELSEDYHIEGSPKNEVMLELKHISNCHRKHSRHKLDDISLTIHKGEILGIAGVEGNGQKELAEVITGIQKTGSGEILLDGANLAGEGIRGRYEAGCFLYFRRQTTG